MPRKITELSRKTATAKRLQLLRSNEAADENINRLALIVRSDYPHKISELRRTDNGNQVLNFSMFSTFGLTEFMYIDKLWTESSAELSHR